MTFANNKILFEIFEDPYQPTVEDIVAVGGTLEWKLLRQAYKHGIFPWPHEGYPLLWFAPEERGVIDFAQMHIPRSLKKWMRQNENLYQIKMDTKFSEVVRQCRNQVRKEQNGTWINDEIEKAYADLFNQGYAFSCEVYRQDRLVGGIYGVKSDKYCSCESMFHLEDNTSKLALIKLAEKLTSEGYPWMDIQMVTNVCESLGGYLIPKDQFLKRIGF